MIALATREILSLLKQIKRGLTQACRGYLVNKNSEKTIY